MGDGENKVDKSLEGSSQKSPSSKEEKVSSSPSFKKKGTQNFRSLAKPRRIGINNTVHLVIEIHLCFCLTSKFSLYFFFIPFTAPLGV